ncbi:hypothetical protein TNCV_3672221 [Trichonephila clavipes]|nr:hypothetical protein TNCV_3672221 [Trichonephila clavipes]
MYGNVKKEVTRAHEEVGPDFDRGPVTLELTRTYTNKDHLSTARQVLCPKPDLKKSTSRVRLAAPHCRGCEGERYATEPDVVDPQDFEYISLIPNIWLSDLNAIVTVSVRYEFSS